MGGQCVSSNRKRQRTQYSEQDVYDDKQHFRTVSIKCSTFFTEQARAYYTNQINQVTQQNKALHLKIKIASYLEDEQSYVNISNLLGVAHHATLLKLNLSNSLLRKRMLFKIIKERMRSFDQLRILHLDIGFTYIPNSTIQILLDGVQKCKQLQQVKFDFQLDIYIKKHNDKKEDKSKCLPNDKISYLVAHTLAHSKSIQKISLNFSQIQLNDQDFNAFFFELKQCNHLRQIELILNNCKLDDSSLEMIGQILNVNITTFILHITNNAFKNISSIFKLNHHKFKENTHSLHAINQYQLLEFGLFSTGYKCMQEDLKLFIKQFINFPKISSFQLHLHSNQYDTQLLTQQISQFMQKLNQICINYSITDDLTFSQRMYVDRYWKKKKRMVSIQHIL